MTVAPEVPSRSRLSVIVQYGLLAGPLLSMLDTSIVTVAIEPIARELHAGLATVQWTISGYLLALGTGLAGTAYLARRFGTLPVYRVSLIAFTIVSVACALAPDAGALIGARVVQGLVGAPLVPLAMSMLLGSGGSASGISPLTGVLLFAGPAFGPTVGGTLIDVAGWRAIFLINAPVGVVAAWSAWRLPSSIAPGRSAKSAFDLPGLLMLASGLTLVLAGTSQGGAHGWGGRSAWAPLAAGLALLAVYTRWASRREQPALDLSLARSRVAALSMSLCALAEVVTWAAVFLLPVFVQTAQGRSALAAGVTLAPQGVITGLSTALGSTALKRFTIRTTACTGFVVLTGTSLGLLVIGAHTALWVVAVILACRAASIGLVITPLLTAVTQPLPPDQLGDANTLFTAWEQVAGSFGIGLITALYVSTARSHGVVTALHTAGAVLAAIAACGVIAALALPAARNA